MRTIWYSPARFGTLAGGKIITHKQRGGDRNENEVNKIIKKILRRQNRHCWGVRRRKSQKSGRRIHKRMFIRQKGDGRGRGCGRKSRSRKETPKRSPAFSEHCRLLPLLRRRSDADRHAAPQIPSRIRRALRHIRGRSLKFGAFRLASLVLHEIPSRLRRRRTVMCGRRKGRRKRNKNRF